MRDKLTYINHLNQSIVLGPGNILLGENSVRDYEWKYNTQYSKIAGFKRGITTFKIPIVIVDAEKNEIADEMFSIFERDIEAEKPGKLICGDYYMTGYITAKENRDFVYHKIIKIELTFATDEPFWIKETDNAFIEGSMGDGLDYPWDYSFDYTNSLNISILNNANFTSSDFRLVIFGPCNNPQINIGGHLYNVDVEVGENEYLTIDSYNKTVYLTKKDGAKINEFANRNVDSYIFEKIPSGQSNVSWSDGIERFVITLIERRSEPKWS